MDYYIHNVPGRLRLRTPLVKGNRASAKHVEGLVKQLRGVDSADVNTITGSVVVHYCQKTISSDVILSALENEGLFDSSRVVSHDQYIHKSASKAGQVIGKFLFGALVEKAIENAGLALVRAMI
jgi:Heavy metal associated domain 2